MVNIVIDQVEKFRTFFEVIYDMSSESLELQLHPDRMVCSILDRTKTRFFHVEYDASFFDKYDVEDVDSVVIFIEDLYKLLKSCNRTDVISLEIKDPYLIAQVESDKGNKRIFEFVLSSDIVNSPVPPHAEFPVVFEMDVGDLKQSVKDIKLVGTDLFTFMVNDETLTLTSSSDSSVNYANQIDIELDNPVANPISASFTLDFIAQMTKFEKISKTVKLKLGDDLPLFYYFKDNLMDVTVTGMIAPRISDE